MSEHFAFAPEILRRLGEELVPHPDQGIVELVRNAYDADATSCVVELRGVEHPGGTVVVSDNGDGMDRSSVANGWLVLGRSAKSRRQVTRLGRVPAGDKGLGRLAAMRLGEVASMVTRPRSEPGVEYRLEIDWRRFEDVRVVEDVPLSIEGTASTETPGTRIELSGLRTRLRRADISRLTRALVLLADPFESGSGFRPELRAPGFSEMEQRVRAAYFDEAEYSIRGVLDDRGHASAELLDWRGQVIRHADHPLITRRKRDGMYATAPARFELWAFKLDAAAFSAREAGVTEVRRWLSIVGGVHVYQNNLRVPPYGDTSVDWLNMNLRRARSPEARPSTNNSVGRVVLSDPGDLLIQKTDRSGFVENEAFTELRSFAMDVLDWAAYERLKEDEVRRAAARERASRESASTEEDVQTVADTLEATSSPKASAAFQRYRKAIERQMKSLHEDVQLYRTLGTVGTTTSAFAHESVKPAARIEQAAKLIQKKGKREFGGRFDEALGSQLASLLRSAKALGRWAQLPLHLLKRDRRRPIRFDLGETVKDVVDMLQPFMSEAKIDLDFTRAPERTWDIYGPPAAAEAIVMNLIVNSINSLTEDDRTRRSRRIIIDCNDAGDGFVALVVADTGPGIRSIDIDDIWLPGRTTRSGGTGLGLTIVRDSVLDLGGEVAVVPNGPLGGAEFTVRVPMLDQESS